MIETPQPTCASDWTSWTAPVDFSGRDRRASPRRKVIWRAEAGGAPCGVRDVNAKGAQILLPSAQALPERLVLFIRHRRADYPAAVVWREGAAAGLRFVGASTLN